uniref:Pre-mRNA-splicing factor ATP-dependent RNA helicase n=1 Tax=Arundo donax TaxID=35708 RepID=A0A0A9A8T8_ARUDO
MYAWYTFKRVRWSLSMWPNRAFVSPAAFRASLGWRKQLGARGRI